MARIENQIQAHENRLAPAEEDAVLIPYNLEDALNNMVLKVDGNPGYPGEAPQNTCLSLLDAKWCGKKCEDEDFCLVYRFSTPIIIRGYGIRSANDCPDRDPLVWSVFAEEGGEKLIHQVDGTDGETELWGDDRFKMVTFRLENPVETDYFELKIHKKQESEEEHCQINEVVLLQ